MGQAIEKNEALYIETFRKIVQQDRLIEDYAAQIEHLTFLNEQHKIYRDELKARREQYRPDGMGE